MRKFSFVLLFLVPFAGGCGFAQNMRKNLIASPFFAATECVDHHRHMQMGREAFAEMVGAFPEYSYSCDYRRGFVDGFADYLDFGGVGDPPPIPPPSYRISRYETPEGLSMMEDWTVGFRHGAGTAKASGLRNLVTIPVYDGPKYGRTYQTGVQSSPPANVPAVPPARPPSAEFLSGPPIPDEPRK